MMIKRYLTALTIILSMLVSAPALAYDPLAGPCATAPNSPACQQNTKQQDATKANENPVAKTLQTVANIMAVLTGIVAVIMIIVSGFIYVTAGGAVGGQRSGDSPSRSKKARATLSSAVVGLIIVALSWSIVTFIVQRFIH